MKEAIILICANFLSALCIGTASFLLYSGRAGWGWFLFVGTICAVTPKTIGKQ